MEKAVPNQVTDLAQYIPAADDLAVPFVNLHQRTLAHTVLPYLAAATPSSSPTPLDPRHGGNRNEETAEATDPNGRTEHRR